MENLGKQFKLIFNNLYKLYRVVGLFKFKCFLVKTCHRIILEKKLEHKIKNYTNNSSFQVQNVIDYGAGLPRYKSLLPNADWNYFDKYPKNNEVKYASTDFIPFDKTDLLICIEVLEYLNHEETKSLMKEISRLIKVNGFAILTTPFLFPIKHNEITRIANPNILKNFLDEKYSLEFYSFGNFFSIMHDAIHQFICRNKFRFFRLFLVFFILPLKIFAMISEKFYFLNLPSGYLITIKSKN